MRVLIAIGFVAAVIAEKPAVCSATLGGQEGKLSAETLADYEVLQVQVITRHGARSPYHTLPNMTNPHHFVCQLHGTEKEISGRWPAMFRMVDIDTRQPLDPQPSLKLGTQSDGLTCAPGGLMLEGVKQTRAIGALLREAYGDLLKGLPASDMYVRSEAIPRVILSSASLMAGLLLGTDGDATLQSSGYDILVKHPEKMETMNGLPCAKANVLKDRADKAHKYPKSIEKALGKLFALDDFHPYLQTVDPAIADVTFTALCDNGVLPCGPGGCLGQTLQKVLVKQYNEKWDSQFAQGDGLEYSKLLMYPLVEEVLQRMSATTRPKFALYTGRDLVIGPVAAALGFFDGVWPPFASHIIFELWSKKGASDTHSVRVLFDGFDVTAKIDGCASHGELCPLATVAKAVQQLLSPYSTREQACADVEMAALIDEPGPSMAFGFASLAFVAGACVAVTFVGRSRRSSGVSIEQPLL